MAAIDSVIARLNAVATEHDLDSGDLETAIELALDATRARKAQGAILDDLAELTAAREAADEKWRGLVAAAARMGISQARIAEYAGCSPAWAGRVARAVNCTQPQHQ